MMHTMGVNILAGECRAKTAKFLCIHLEINGSDKSVAICCSYPVVLSLVISKGMEEQEQIFIHVFIVASF
jgi:hypothetical protein